VHVSVNGCSVEAWTRAAGKGSFSLVAMVLRSAACFAAMSVALHGCGSDSGGAAGSGGSGGGGGGGGAELYDGILDADGRSLLR
jgi:hypothetical protein